MRLFLGWGDASIGPSAGFFFDSEPRVHVGPGESRASVLEMPHFVNVLDGVAFLYSHFEFGSTPRAFKGALIVCVMAGMRLFQKGFANVLLDAGTTQWEGEFIVTMVRQHGMVETLRW